MNARIIFMEISKGKMAQALLAYYTCFGGLSARLKEKILVNLFPIGAEYPAW